MKINTKSELKALIKECLIEILSEGTTTIPRTRPAQNLVKQESSKNSLPDGVPPSMKSLFADSQRRAAEKMYQESLQSEKQQEVLEEMAGTWENMAFSGGPLPSRGLNPYNHIGHTPSPLMSGNGMDSNYDDEFDPYEAVKNAIPKRK